METIPDGTESFTKFRTASVAQNGPDVMGMWSGSYMLGVSDFLEPLNDYFTPEERERITGWEATSADFRADSDQIYGVPAGSDGTSCFYYNTELLANAGVDPEASWPASFDEFATMLGTIAESGVTPMALHENAIIWQILSWWQAQMLGGADQVGKIVTGETNFSNPTLTEIVANWQTLRDYTIPGAETMPGCGRSTLFCRRSGHDHLHVLDPHRRARSAGREPGHGQDSGLQRRGAAQERWHRRRRGRP